MKILIILLFGWNVCVGQDGWRKADTVIIKNKEAYLVDRSKNPYDTIGPLKDRGGVIAVGEPNDNGISTMQWTAGNGVKLTGTWPNYTIEDTIFIDSAINNATYGYIQFIADTTKEINFTIYIKGYSIDHTHDVPGYCIGCVYKTEYFDLKGKQLFVQRFKKGKFLNFYQ